MQFLELELGQQHAAPAAHDLAQRDRADRLEARVDDVDVVEIVRQVRIGAQIVDRLTDRPELRRGDEVALHQTAGAVLGVGQALLDGRALGQRQRLEQSDLLVFVEIAEDLDRVVGVELGDRCAGLLGTEQLEHLGAHAVVEMGQELGIEPELELGDQRGSSPRGRAAPADPPDRRREAAA